jgi:hypothetical protein
MVGATVALPSHEYQPSAIVAPARSITYAQLEEIMKPLASIELAEPYDANKPFFLYIGQIHRGPEERQDVIESQIGIYNILAALHQERALHAIFNEGYHGKYPHQRPIGPLQRSDIEKLLKEIRTNAATLFFMSYGFSEVYGAGSRATEEMVQRKSIEQVIKNYQTAEFLFQEIQKGRGVTVSQAQLSGLAEAYDDFKKYDDAYTTDSYEEPLRTVEPRRNITVIMGYAHEAAMKERFAQGQLETLRQKYNLCFVLPRGIDYEGYDRREATSSQRALQAQEFFTRALQTMVEQNLDEITIRRKD